MSANVRIKVLPLSFRRRQKLRKYGPLVVWLTAEVGGGGNDQATEGGSLLLH